jgi:prepilin-type processing-associated H-X9-DG protein
MATGFDYNPALGPGTEWNYDNWPTVTLKNRNVQYSIGKVAETKRTIAFAESAKVDWSMKFLENLGGLQPPSGNFPNAHFRHMAMANVLFLDGHVEAYPRKFTIVIGPWLPQA